MDWWPIRGLELVEDRDVVRFGIGIVSRVETAGVASPDSSLIGQSRFLSDTLSVCVRVRGCVRVCVHARRPKTSLRVELVGARNKPKTVRFVGGWWWVLTRGIIIIITMMEIVDPSLPLKSNTGLITMERIDA